jgi:hypothetical protein
LKRELRMEGRDGHIAEALPIDKLKGLVPEKK